MAQGPTTHPLKAKALVDRRKCKGFSKSTGQSCNNWAHPDTGYCHWHEGQVDDRRDGPTTSEPENPLVITDYDRATVRKIAKRSYEKAGANLPEDPQTNLRTLEDCLTVIEYAVDNLLTLSPTTSQARALVYAAKAAGDLIIKADIADKAVDWFKDNVKLVADVDLGRV